MNDLHEYNNPHNITQIEHADPKLLSTERRFNYTNHLGHKYWAIPQPAIPLSRIACRIKNKPWLASSA